MKTNDSTICIEMPKGCRYMSEYPELLNMIPSSGWYILNKGLCGCGGTTLFLESEENVILASPRSNMLLSKHNQYPHSTHLFRESKKESISKVKARLREYILNSPGPKKILTTIDSYKHVADVLLSEKVMWQFKVVSDEFQCLMSDASYKGQTELEFLECLHRTAKDVCFMSATPIDESYLGFVSYFNGIPYYQISWDPDVTEIPNLKEVLLKRNETPRTVCKGIIDGYRNNNGIFSQKIWDGQIVYSREVCIYLNELRLIIKIIKENGLRPDEVTILCSSSTSQKDEIKRMGFSIGGQCTDRNNPKNKPFTFCTRASFEGMDMYSTNACTYIFVNAHKEWETFDISIDLPQILARQRLHDINPFCRDAVIYYKTKSNPETPEQIKSKMDNMLRLSEERIAAYEHTSVTMQRAYVSALRNQKESEQYKECFIDVVDCGNQGYKLQINGLVILARMNLWRMQSYYYSNPVKLVAGITHGMSSNYKEKPDCLTDFERQFYACSSWSERMKMYCSFRDTYTQETMLLLNNPFIPVELHCYYDILGHQRMYELEYREDFIMKEYELSRRYYDIQGLCKSVFMQNVFYTLPDIKEKLTNIYSTIGISGTPSAVDIEKYLAVKSKNGTDNTGKRVKGYVIC